MIVSIFWEMNCSFQLLFMNVLTFGGRKRGGGGGGGGGGVVGRFDEKLGDSR